MFLAHPEPTTVHNPRPQPQTRAIPPHTRLFQGECQQKQDITSHLPPRVCACPVGGRMSWHGGRENVTTGCFHGLFLEFEKQPHRLTNPYTSSGRGLASSYRSPLSTLPWTYPSPCLRKLHLYSQVLRGGWRHTFPATPARHMGRCELGEVRGRGLGLTPEGLWEDHPRRALAPKVPNNGPEGCSASASRFSRFLNTKALKLPPFNAFHWIPSERRHPQAHFCSQKRGH